MIAVPSCFGVPKVRGMYCRSFFCFAADSMPALVVTFAVCVVVYCKTTSCNVRRFQWSKILKIYYFGVLDAPCTKVRISAPKVRRIRYIVFLQLRPRRNFPSFFRFFSPTCSSPLSSAVVVYSSRDRRVLITSV